MAIASLVVLSGCTTRFLMPSRSMVPTIQPGSHVIVDRTAYRQGAPQRFDIVVFVPPDDRKSHYAFRVVGLPGEHVQLDATGVSVDGKPVKPPDGLAYVAFTRPEHKTVSDITLGQREYFLLGDNPQHARDSRFFGPVPRDDILWKVTRIEPPAADYRDPHAADQAAAERWLLDHGYTH